MISLYPRQTSRLWLPALVSFSVLTGGLIHPLPVQAQDDSPGGYKEGVDTDDERWVDEVRRHLPPGVTLESADKETLIAAIQAAVLANPNAAPEIAGAIAGAVSLERSVIVAEALGRLFRTHPAIAGQAPDIGTAMATALDTKTNNGERARALYIGYVGSTLIYYLNPKESANQHLITQVVSNILTVTPKLEYSRAIFGTIISTLRALGVTDNLIALIENNVLDAMSDPMIRNQLRTELWQVFQGPDQFFPGAIITEETPVVNS